MPDDGPSRKKKKASGTDVEGADLWRLVRKVVTPLVSRNRYEPHGDLEQKFSALVNEGKPVKEKETRETSPSRPTAPSYTPPVSEPKEKRRRSSPPQLADFQRREVRRILTGSLLIDGTLDLHGKTQDKALPALKRFLGRHQQLGSKVVLVITGKGNSRKNIEDLDEHIFYENHRAGGVLQEMVPIWLENDDFREMVVSYRTAHRTHGEEGALYIHVRRPGRR